MADHPLHLLDTNVLLALIRAGPLGEHIDKTYQPRQAKFKPLISSSALVSCYRSPVNGDGVLRERQR